MHKKAVSLLFFVLVISQSMLANCRGIIGRFCRDIVTICLRPEWITKTVDIACGMDGDPIKFEKLQGELCDEKSDLRVDRRDNGIKIYYHYAGKQGGEKFCTYYCLVESGN